ncbi:MAG: hypothetical protein WCF95_00460 [bacterium]
MVSGLNYLQNDLAKYGISATGNIQSDLAALKAAKQAKGESTSEIDTFTNMIARLQKNGKLPPMQSVQDGMQTPPWESMMQSLGLQLQGSREADFAAIQSKITQLESATDLTSEQKANLATLKTQFEQMKKIAKQHHHDHKSKKVGKEGQKPQGPPPEAPWFTMMKTLGIQPQGSPKADFTAIQNKINQMKSTTLPADQKANLESLQAQLEQYELQVK